MAEPKSAWRTFRESELVVIFITSFWLIVVLQYYIPMVLFLPISFIPGVGVHWYRQLSGAYDVHWGRHSCLSIPFSWCGCRIYINDFEFLMKFKEKGNGLLLSTHCSRVDWLLAVYVGMVGRSQVRVGFVAEVTTALMPIIGWSRYLLGDILLQRAFHKDRPRILDNISNFHKSKVDRVLFLAPEGTIADPGLDDEYVKACEQFMITDGHEPLTHLLTPRYKGMSAFVLHSPDNVASCSMTFVTDHPKIDPKTGAIVGGKKCSLGMHDPDRMIPDLHTIFTGGMAAFVSIKELKLYSDPGLAGEELDDVGAKKIREQLIQDQIFKDKEMRCFAETGKFPGVKSGADMQLFPTLHFRMNATLILHTLFTIKTSAWLFGCSDMKVVKYIIGIIFIAFMLHGGSHKIGQWTTDGRSRESLVGETAIKAFLNVVFKRSMNQGGKPKEDEQTKKKN
jgi:1-acyl-sn-glycerol-3-phosphate acyltransferase